MKGSKPYNALIAILGGIPKRMVYGQPVRYLANRSRMDYDDTGDQKSLQHSLNKIRNIACAWDWRTGRAQFLMLLSNFSNLQSVHLMATLGSTGWERRQLDGERPEMLRIGKELHGEDYTFPSILCYTKIQMDKFVSGVQYISDGDS